MWRRLVHRTCTQASLRTTRRVESVRQTPVIHRSVCSAHARFAPPTIAATFSRFQSTAASRTAKDSSIDCVQSAQQDGLFLDVKWRQNGSNRYPFVYLRDNCPCPACRDPNKHRTFDFVAEDLDIDIQPREIKTASDGSSVQLVWPDGHQSTFDNLWLNDFQLRPGEEHLSSQHFKLPSRVLWTPDELLEVMPSLRFSYDEVWNEPAAMYKWMEAVWRYGFTVLEGAGTDETVRPYENLLERMGGVRTSHYGKIYMIEHKPEIANSIAYDGEANFPLHTDLMFYQDRPGVVSLHALAQAPIGGETLFCDGFMAGELLRKEKPHVYDILKTIDVEFGTHGYDANSGLSYVLRSSHPVIREDENGAVDQINFGIHNRTFRLELDPGKVHEFYDAFHYFAKLCHASCFPYKIRAGDMVVFDVWRIVHGRGPMKLKSAKKRRLRGCYVDFDHFLSYWRVLHQQLYGKQS